MRRDKVPRIAKLQSRKETRWGGYFRGQIVRSSQSNELRFVKGEYLFTCWHEGAAHHRRSYYTHGRFEEITDTQGLEEVRKHVILSFRHCVPYFGNSILTNKYPVLISPILDVARKRLMNDLLKTTEVIR